MRQTINKQKTLRRDCIYNIENTVLEIGVSGVYYYLLLHFETYVCCRPAGPFYTLRINL